jgi:uncharacterized membrane protein (DUF485 family)
LRCINVPRRRLPLHAPREPDKEEDKMAWDSEAALVRLAAERVRVATTMTVLMVAVYFGFILLVAFAKDWLAMPIVPGLSLGILLGAGVIVFAWVLTLVYVRWANGTFDSQVEAIVREG